MQAQTVIHPQCGTRVIRFKRTAEGWLDPSAVRCFFDLRNELPAKQLRPLNAPHAFFNRLSIKMRGVIVEVIQDYNRVHEMFSIHHMQGK